MEQITRKQLIGYGVSRYHAKTLTQSLDPVGGAYPVRDVIGSIRDYLERPQIKPQTRQTLESVLTALLEYLGNKTEVPFGQSQDSELADSTKQLARAMARTDSSLAKMKATSARIRAEYKS